MIAAGRASEILDLGDGRLLRRFKQGGDPHREAVLMRLAAEHGYPVPRVDDVLDDGLVLELVDGPTMLADCRRRPWRIGGHARTLARLHEELHRIPLEGAALLHLDLHPANVLLSSRGPVVIDWTNARAGNAAVDPAVTWVILMTSGGPGGRVLARRFGREIDVRTGMAEAVAFRLADPNVTDREREAVKRLARSGS